MYLFTLSLLHIYCIFIIQQIVTLSKYGHIAVYIFVIHIFCDQRSFVSRGKRNGKKCRRNDSNTLKERLVINLLNYKTIILLNLAEYRLRSMPTASSAKYHTRFRAISQDNC